MRCSCATDDFVGLPYTGFFELTVFEFTGRVYMHMFDVDNSVLNPKIGIFQFDRYGDPLIVLFMFL